MGGGDTDADGFGESLLMNARLQVFENPTAGCTEAHTEPAGPPTRPLLTHLQL